jgi:hypothetical protein
MQTTDVSNHAPRYHNGDAMRVVLAMDKREALALLVLLSVSCPGNRMAQGLFDRLAQAVKTYEANEKEQVEC